MNDVLKQLIALEKLSNQLEPSNAERVQYSSLLVKYAGEFIDALPNNDAYKNGKPGEGTLSIDGKAHSLEEIIHLFMSEVEPYGIKPASGGHIGYIPGGGIYAAALGDYLADVTNLYAGMYFASPGAVTIENELISWLKSIFRFPAESIGNITSGGSIANLIALTAARDQHGIKGNKIKKSIIYLSPQTHHCIHKAIRIIGLEEIIIRELPITESHHINVDKFYQLVQTDKEMGLEPFMVVASAGTTDTGSVDSLYEIGRFANEENIWYHIDAAYGGFFILTETKKHLFKGIETADSLVIDPHKGLFLPYGTGAVLIKNKTAVYHSHHYVANYMQDAIINDLEINPADVSPELTKHFRGMRMWLPLKLHGIEPFIACLNEKLLLTIYFRNELIKLGFSVGPEPDLTVSYFWYPTNDGDENNFNRKLMDEIHNDGSIFLSSTTINGKFVIRIAILSFRTKRETIDKAIVMIKNCLNHILKSS